MRHETLPYPSPHLSSDLRQASWTSTALLLPRPPRLRSLQRHPEAALPRWLVAVGAGYAHIPEPQSLQLAYRTRPCESKKRSNSIAATAGTQQVGALAEISLSWKTCYQKPFKRAALPHTNHDEYTHTSIGPSFGVQVHTEQRSGTRTPRDGGAVI